MLPGQVKFYFLTWLVVIWVYSLLINYHMVWCMIYALFCEREGGREWTNLARPVFTKPMLAPRDHLFSLEMLINCAANQNNYSILSPCLSFNPHDAMGSHDVVHNFHFIFQILTNLEKPVALFLLYTLGLKFLLTMFVLVLLAERPFSLKGKSKAKQK